jgi:Flp pilus assembly protein TadG
MPRLSIALAAAALAVAAGPSAAHDPAAHRAEPAQYQLHDPANCFCRAQGKTFAVGETACLRTGEGPRVAECGMVLNNTSWRFTARPCPES